MKKQVLLIAMLLMVFDLQAQFQLGQMVMPFQNIAPEAQNPALTQWYGVPQLNFSAGTRIDGFGNRPTYQNLVLSAPTGNSTGAALSLQREAAGLSNYISAGFSFLYSLNIAPEKATRLVFHGTGVVSQMSFNMDDAVVNHASDPILAGGTTHQPAGNASAGLALMSQNKYYAGISASQLIPVRYSFMNQFGDNETHMVFSFQGAYVFALDQYASLQGWASAGLSQRLFSYQAGVDFKYRKMFWTGLGYRSNGALLVNAGITAQSFSFGYAFSYGFADVVSNNASYAGLSHSIFIRKVFNELKPAR